MISYCNPGRRFNITAYSVLESLVDAVLQTVTLFTTPKKCRLTTRFKTWPLKSIHFLRTKVNITSCSKVNGSEHQLT